MYRRFYNAMILFYLVNEQPLVQVTRLLKAERGEMQALQKNASVFCAMLVVFCQKLNWPMLAAALDSVTSRLSLGVGEDILPLARLGSELSATRCRALLKSGIKTPTDILRGGRATVANVLVRKPIKTDYYRIYSSMTSNDWNCVRI